ncbi:MAG TPA: hypothetical protein VMG11_12330 [Steroidobacteraceae bacterium]|nr:hypothetical protein [Steroidobacteraceae bacterium]
MACLALVACGASGKSGSSVRGAVKRAAVHQKAKSGPVIDADMVSAVPNGKGTSPLEVKFALRQHPMTGHPVQLDLTFIPSIGLDRIAVSFLAEDGLVMRDGSHMPLTEHLEAGVPISHSLTFIPQRDGIFYVSATVLMDWGDESVARTYTIPVLAGVGTSGQDSAPELSSAAARVLPSTAEETAAR